MKKIIFILMGLILLSCSENQPAKQDKNDKVSTVELAPLPIKLPTPRIPPTPKNIPPDAHVKAVKQWTPREPFLAPKGCTNVALGKQCSSSDNEPVLGQISQVTDGNKEGSEDSYVELGYGVQWVQLDLEVAHEIQAIVIWHEHRLPTVYYDVIIQVSDDKDFIENVQTLFNNDHDNSAGMGLGNDWGYFENHEGRLFSAKGVRSRYLRFYSNGSTSDDLNRYTEVEVYAIPKE